MNDPDLEKGLPPTAFSRKKKKGQGTQLPPSVPPRKKNENSHAQTEMCQAPLPPPLAKKRAQFNRVTVTN